MNLKIVRTFAALSLITVVVWCHPCTKEHSVDISSGMFLTDGSVLHKSILYESGQWYPDKEYGQPVFRGCPCVLGTCIWKCCDDKQVLLNRNCTAGIGEFNPPIFKGKDQADVTDRRTFTAFTHYPTCKERYVVDPNMYKNEELYIQENGTLMEVTQGRSQWILPSDYCVDMMMDNDTQPPRLVALVCLPDEPNEDDSPALYISYAVDRARKYNLQEKLDIYQRWVAFSEYYDNIIRDRNMLPNIYLIAPTEGNTEQLNEKVSGEKFLDGAENQPLNSNVVNGVYNIFNDGMKFLEVLEGRTQSNIIADDNYNNNNYETQPPLIEDLYTTKPYDFTQIPSISAEFDDTHYVVEFSISSPGLLLSVPFLMATFLVYVFIPELRNLHGMCLMAYCAGLIVAYIFLAYLKVHIGEVGVTVNACMVIAFIVYYAFQTSFFWLNVMCFDIWRTFSGHRGSSTTKRREMKRFAVYGMYAWGVPLLLTACTAGMQSANVPPYIITPGFGDKRCWFSDWLSELVYFFTPVLVLVVCNVVLFLITAYRIRSIKQETSILKGSKSTNKLKQDKQRYTLYLKLFVVMGVNWTVELISFVVGGSNWYWIVIDISNIMLGFFIFMIFVWKKKVRNLVTKRYRSFRGLPQTSSEFRKSTTATSTAVTDESRLSEDPGVRLKDLN